MTAVVIVLDGKPVPKGRPRFGKGHAYTPPATKAYEKALAWEAKIAMQGRKLFWKPLAVMIDATFSTATVRGDWDNYAKIACDALNGIVWNDDSQIVEAHVRKLSGAKPSLRIEVTEL